jgi:hypothetical protein
MLYVSNVIDSALDYQILKKGEPLDCLFFHAAEGDGTRIICI